LINSLQNPALVENFPSIRKMSFLRSLSQLAHQEDLFFAQFWGFLRSRLVGRFELDNLGHFKAHLVLNDFTQAISVKPRLVVSATIGLLAPPLPALSGAHGSEIMFTSTLGLPTFSRALLTKSPFIYFVRVRKPFAGLRLIVRVPRGCSGSRQGVEHDKVMNHARIASDTYRHAPPP